MKPNGQNENSLVPDKPVSKQSICFDMILETLTKCFRIFFENYYDYCPRPEFLYVF